MGLGAAIAKVGRPLVDYALPPRCPGCGVIVPHESRFCLSCWSSLRFLGAPCCSRCGEPFDFDMGPDAECASCLASPPAYDSARAAVAYGPTAAHVAMRLKYARRLGLARLMAQFMVTALPEKARLEGNWILVPVPLHRWRQWSRGFNQADLIAQHVARLTGISVENRILERHRATHSLRNLGGRQRYRAVKGAFRITTGGKEKLMGKNILLIDDVHTSGATAEACTRALRLADVASVHLISWARVVRND